MNKYISTLICCISFFAFSCKDNGTDPKPVTGSEAIVVRNLAANPEEGGTGKYTFFNLKNNVIIPATDSATTKWDIAFNATTIIINSGSSGPGTAGAQMHTGLFENLTEAPATGYLQDAASGKAISTGSGNGWYNYNSTTHVISAIPGRILVVRTNDNTYAKIEIISYYKNAPATPVNTDISRYYTFRYVHQGDGTRKF
jgi:hypothetical protein